MRSCGNSGGDGGGDGTGDHAEGEDDVGDSDDVGNGGGVNSASIPIVRSFDSSFIASFTTRAVAILHSPGRGADAGIDTCAGVGVGAVVSFGGLWWRQYGGRHWRNLRQWR